GTNGIPGDRAWALRDEVAGEIRGAKKLPVLMRCSARFLSEPEPGQSPTAEILLPDGASLRTDAPDVSAKLSELVGRQVTLCRPHPAAGRGPDRRGMPDNPAMPEELREVFGRLPPEPLPDLSVFPEEIMEFTSPLGTYFDAFPLHFV